MNADGTERKAPDAASSRRLSHVVAGCEAVAFVIAGNTAEIKRIGTPVTGTTLLIALAILAYTALSQPLETFEADLDPVR